MRSRTCVGLAVSCLSVVTVGAAASADRALPVPLRATQPRLGIPAVWGRPDLRDEFRGRVVDQQRWWVYDGPGHDGHGIRSPEQVRVHHGRLHIVGTPGGRSGGMGWQGGQRYGRWAVRMRLREDGHRQHAYHPVLLLWPDSEQWPAGGEYDFMETDLGTHRFSAFLHYAGGDGSDQQVQYDERSIDLTRWHTYAIRWTPRAVAGFVDGRRWFRCRRPVVQAPGPMHLAVQLDNNGGHVHDRGHMVVDWVHIWRRR